MESVNIDYKQKGYKKLKVWEESHRLVTLVYKNTKNFPKEEYFGLVSQMRRAAISVVANIIEGQARMKNEFYRFLMISNGSLAELEYYLQLSLDLKYISINDYKVLENQRYLVGRLLGGLIKSKRKKS